MALYDFEVLRDGAVIAAAALIDLPHIRAAWPEIARLARRHPQPGARIRVTDETGRIVILTGVVSVRRHADGIAA
jgi:hypothetical protein